MSEELDTSTGVEEAQPVQTMDDTIRQTLADIESRGEPEPANEETAEQKAERQRDEKGRFAPKAEKPEPVAAAEPAPEQAPEAAPEPAVPPELQKLGVRKEAALAIAKDPVVMQEFIRRSDEMHRGLEQYRQKAHFGDAMERAIAPFAQNLQQYGIPPDVAVQKLLTTENALRHGNPQQKMQMLTQLARDYGIDLGQTQEFAANMPQPDPRVQALEQRLQQQEAWINQQNQAREWQERQSLNSEISGFASNPDHKHFEEVRSDMAGLLQAGLAPDLKTAYEMAIYANPNVRAKVLAEQQAKAEADRRAEADRKAKEARAAAAVNVTRKGTLPAAKPIGTMDDTIRETAARLGLIA